MIYRLIPEDHLVVGAFKFDRAVKDTQKRCRRNLVLILLGFYWLSGGLVKGIVVILGCSVGTRIFAVVSIVEKLTDAVGESAHSDTIWEIGRSFVSCLILRLIPEH